MLLDGLAEALRLLVHLDPEVLDVALRSLGVSLAATAVAVAVGVALGTTLALNRFPGKTALVAVVNAGMGVPPVVVGLFVSMLLWRSGPLGGLELLYTPAAMILAQAVIATPIVTGLSLAAMQALPPGLRLQALAMGATRPQMVWLLMREARLPLLAAVMAGFGGVISEVGASIMVGGNIKGQTRVLTTATVTETSRGNFDLAIALSVLLLGMTLAVTYVLTAVQQRERPR